MREGVPVYRTDMSLMSDSLPHLRDDRAHDRRRMNQASVPNLQRATPVHFGRQGNN